jgi:hypothetical protein
LYVLRGEMTPAMPVYRFHITTDNASTDLLATRFG